MLPARRCRQETVTGKYVAELVEHRRKAPHPSTHRAHACIILSQKQRGLPVKNVEVRKLKQHHSGDAYWGTVVKPRTLTECKNSTSKAEEPALAANGSQKDRRQGRSKKPLMHRAKSGIFIFPHPELPMVDVRTLGKIGYFHSSLWKAKRGRFFFPRNIN
jgi:hypothetical protein